MLIAAHSFGVADGGFRGAGGVVSGSVALGAFVGALGRESVGDQREGVVFEDDGGVGGAL